MKPVDVLTAGLVVAWIGAIAGATLKGCAQKEEAPTTVRPPGDTGEHLGYWIDPKECDTWGPNWLACPEPWRRAAEPEVVRRICRRRGMGKIYCAPLTAGTAHKRRRLAGGG